MLPIAPHSLKFDYKFVFIPKVHSLKKLWLVVVRLGPSWEKKAIPCVNESHCVSLPAGLLSRSQWTDLNLSPYINIPKEVKPISSKDKET